MNTNTQHGIAVTGALGNLGWKLLCHLAQYGEISTLIGLDLPTTTPGKLEHLKTISQKNSQTVFFLKKIPTPLKYGF